MQQKTTVERVLHYIGRKLRKDADGNEVISKHHAELAAKMAFEGGRQSVVENIPELEWESGAFELMARSQSIFGTYYIYRATGPFFTCFCETKAIPGYGDCFLSIDAAKQAAHEDYKQRIKQALGL